MYTISNNSEVYVEPVPRAKKIPHRALKFEAGDGLFRQNLCGNGTGTGSDTIPKYRACLSSHISCSVKF